jgi:hypothetical protein
LFLAISSRKDLRENNYPKFGPFILTAESSD